MMTKKLICGLISVSLLSNSALVHAGGGGVAGATEVTQILNNVQLLEQSSQMYQQVQQTIMQVNMAQQQLKNLIAAPQFIWGQAQAELQQLTNLVAQGQALGYQLANIDEAFSTKYSGYANTAKIDFKTASRQWTATSLDSIKSALQTAGVQSQQFASEESALQTIQSIASGSQGGLQAAQAGVMVASQQVNQLQKLRQLFMAQMQAQNSYMASQEQKEASRRMANEAHFKTHQERQATFSSKGGKN